MFAYRPFDQPQRLTFPERISPKRVETAFSSGHNRGVF